MRAIIALCLIAVAAVAYARPHETYNDQFDEIDLDEIMYNQRLLISNYGCLVLDGKCTPSAKELKKHMRDAMETKCSKCTEAQKKGTRKVIKFLINHKPDLWKGLCDKYDPDRKYSKEYEDDLKELKA